MSGMSSLSAEETRAYTTTELKSLYPEDLRLCLVQVIFRHGERAPVRFRLENAGIPRHFLLCQHVNHFNVMLRSGEFAEWTRFKYTRAVEETQKSHHDGSPIGDNACLLGELTDKGRRTTLQLGQRLRKLYCDQLNFMPDLSSTNQIYLRSSPMPRALESLQQVIAGFYPAKHIQFTDSIRLMQRNFTDEDLYPNEGSCKALRILSEKFAAKAAQNWNPILAGYTSDVLKKFIEPPLRVDGKTRLSGYMDTINAAKGNELPVPPEFNDEEMLETMHAAVIEEWFGGYLQNVQYRRLGIGRLLGELHTRMSAVVNDNSPLKVALYGAHDTTLGALLASLATDRFQLRWPPFTSHIAFETFEKQGNHNSSSKHDNEQYYVRCRYNNRVVPIKGCKDAELCTLKEFERIVQSIAPDDWEEECQRTVKDV